MEQRLKLKLPNGEFLGVTLERSRIMSAIRGKSNRSTEGRLRMALVRNGIRGWVLHSTQLHGRPDFFFSKSRLAVFVDGCFWHGCQKCGHVPKTRSAFWRAKLMRNRERDRRINRLLRQSGIRIIRIWEHTLKTDEGTSASLGLIKRELSR